ncbi:MAK10-like protein [Tanacetum coccineum]
MESVTRSDMMVLPYGMLLTRLYRHVHTTHPYAISDIHHLVDHVMIPLIEGKTCRKWLMGKGLTLKPFRNHLRKPLPLKMKKKMIALVFSTPPSSPIEPHSYLNYLEDLPPRSSNPSPPPPSQGFTQILPQHTPMDFEPFFPPIYLSRRGSRMSAQLEPLMNRDQVLQELGQLYTFSYHLKDAIQNAQNVQDSLLPHFTTISLQILPLPSSFHFTAITITTIPPFRPIIPPSNTCVPLDQALWIEGPSSFPQPQDHLCPHYLKTQTTVHEFQDEMRDYSKASHKGYRNTIELPEGNNVVPLRSDTIWLMQNGCSFHGLRSEDPNQHLKNFLKLMDSLDLDVANRERTRLRLFQFSLRDQASNWLEHLPARSISTWEDLTTRFLAQFSPPRRTEKLRNDILMFQQHQGESLSEAWTRFKDLLQKLRDKNAEESWALLEDLAFYDNESWNDPKDFAKPVKAISLPQDVPSTSDGRLIKLKNQVQRLMEAHLSPKQPVQVNKISSLCEIYGGPHDTQYCMENLKQAFVEYVSLYTNEAGEEEQEEKDNPKNISINPSLPPDPSISFVTEKVRKLNSFLESLTLVPQSSDTKYVCTKGDDNDVLFIEIIKKHDDSQEEGPGVDVNAETEGLEVEYFDIFPTMSELAYHKCLMSGPIPSIFLINPIITEGCPSNLKIPCNIGHEHVEKAYIDLNSPLNIMTRMLYNWIIRRKLDPRDDPNRGVSNFTGRIKGMHVFIGNFTYVIDFMIVEDISSIIDPRLSQVVLRKPFVKMSNMTHDLSEGVVRFTNETNEIT